MARMLQSVLKQNSKALANLFVSSGWVKADTNNIELENTLRHVVNPYLKAFVRDRVW